MGVVGINGNKGNTGPIGPTGPQGLINNSFSFCTAATGCPTGNVPTSQTEGQGNGPMPNFTNSTYLVNDNPPCFTPGDPQLSQFPGRSLTLPSAVTAGAGREITLININVSATGCFLFVYPPSGQKLLYLNEVIPGQNVGGIILNGLIVPFYGRFVSDGANWRGIDAQ
jgi:hypothetical protein